MKALQHFILLPIIAVFFAVTLFGTTVSLAELDPTNLSARIVSEQDKHAESLNSDLRSSVVGIINYFLAFLGLVAVGYIIYAGIIMLTGEGEEDSVSKGRKIIMYAILGIVVIFLSWTIVNFVADIPDSVDSGGNQ